MKEQEEEGKEYELSSAALTVIKDIQKIFKTVNQDDLVVKDDFPEMLETFGITKDNIATTEESELIAKFTTLMEAEATSFFEFIVAQGFDFWLTQSVLNCEQPQKVGLSLRLVQDIILNKRVRYMIEKEYCKGQ